MPKQEQARTTAFGGERIAKVMARAGLCSRRDAERWIAEGRVSVNGRVISSPAVNVTDKDQVLVDGRPLPETPGTRLWRYHKPAGLVVSHRDPQGRPTVFEKLPEEMPRVVSVGRLDLNTEGLLLLTNDGALARRLELPETGWTRRYRIRAFGSVEPEALAILRKGIEIDGIRYGPIEARIDRQQCDNVWLTFALAEGKNREVKRVCEHLRLAVNRLIRIAFGPFQLGDLPRGAIEEVPRRVLRDQLGRKLGGEPRKEAHAHRRR
jgi:23S rRNA pseudouridine2605 synthase